MKKIYFITLMLALLVVANITSHAQSSFFTLKGENAFVAVKGKRLVVPDKYETVQVGNDQLSQFLNQLPSEDAVRGRFNSAPILSLPMPDGSFAKFHVWESSIQAPALQARFSEIKTFAGQGIDDPSATIRFDYNPYFGFSAQILSINGRIYIDPVVRGEKEFVMSYYHKDNHRLKQGRRCSVTDEEQQQLQNTQNVTNAGPCLGATLRTYRLAVACTGEYAVAVGGGAAGPTHAAVVASTNRVNGVYEQELSVRMVLIVNNQAIEYLNGATDPYNNVISGTELNNNQTNIDNVIGVGNYDIGHLFTSDDNGLAQLSSVCGTGKARGATGAPSLVGDGFDIDFVAHEMGHQFGAPHTFNSANCASAGGSYEPGGGTTIMAYAGICSAAENVQPNSDAIFHAKSFDDIGTFISIGGGSGCGVSTATNNNLPTIAPLLNNNLSIPINTPFTLSASATDADAGDVISYNWEGWDTGVAGTWTSAANSTTRPLFRTRVSKSVGTRTFPDIRVIAANYPGTAAPSAMDGLRGEVLPLVARAMKFRVTVRDNRAGGAAVVSAGEGCQTGTTFVVNAIGTTPFALTAPNGAESWAGGSSQTITWNTAGSENTPINVTNVKISLSTDGGLTYPTVLAATTANDGSEVITIPNSASTTARIRVEAINSIFFDISNANFSITAAANGFDLGNPSPLAVACPAPANMDITLTTTAIGSFSNPISFTALGAPAGTTVSFIPATVTPGTSVTVRLANASTLPSGNYNIQITGSATGSPSVNRTLVYTVNAGSGPSISTQPVNATICAGGNTTFSIASGTATNFQWQVSTNGGTTFTAVTNGGVFSGATSNTLTLTNAGTGISGSLYRCVASVQCGSTNSNTALLTVNGAANITGQPANATICALSDVSFSTTATGTGLSYQWQISTDAGVNYSNIANGGVYSNATTSALNITGAAASLNANRYRCVVSFTGACTGSLNSNGAILTVATAASITTNPSNITVCAGASTTAIFSATASGANLSFQWQESVNGGAAWNNIANAGVYSGATTASLTITNPAASMNSFQYRCVVVNSPCTANAITTAAILTVNTTPSITTQPAAVTTCLGTNITFVTSAMGTSLTYQWQTSTNGGAAWINLTNGGIFSGVTTATLTLTNVPASVTTNQFRCLVSGTCAPAANSNAVALTVINPVAVTSQPSNATVCAGLATSLTAVASSTQAITYQWQFSTDGGINYNNVINNANYAGATTATLSLTNVPLAWNNQRYRLNTSNTTCSVAAPSSAVTLTVNALPVMAWPNALAAQCANFTTYVLTGATPAGGSYKGPGVTGSNFSATAAGIGTKTIWYLFTNASGCTDSISKTIVVNPAPVLSVSTNSGYTRLLPGFSTTINASISPASSFTTAWSYNNTLIPNAGNSRTVDVTTLGTYSIVGLSDLGCTTAPVSISILDSASSRLFVYPSPNSGKFKVALYNAAGSSTTQILTVYSSSGRKVFEKTYNFSLPWQNHDVDLRNASNGIYLVVVRNGAGKALATGKVMVY